MQLLLHIPDPIAERFKQTVPARQRSAYVADLLEKALPVENDPLYLIALEVEQDAVLNAEMQEWRDALMTDGIRGEEVGGAHAAR
ncbi:hypothetical protein [Desulfovibrio sp. 86]|uniref:Uncharacterized protein n=1 Tax=uncultured Desulfovibrio sp. TaxID=167968 RepID=A0A212KX88_9BACT|nr:hypothetical protein [Desulfovibrio sp. 86]SCM69887.1 conserved hypothetical protein [uncultured Desulfovibrio sp.]VZH35222.1 conserved protein of unknown function [Desulfovibrio sp. 86]